MDEIRILSRKILFVALGKLGEGTFCTYIVQTVAQQMFGIAQLIENSSHS